MVASGQVLKFSSCAVGASWFQGQGRWKGKGYTPSAGDFIFFDWNKDGQVDHVGIVVNVANGRVNTIEGNTSNTVMRNNYSNYMNVCRNSEKENSKHILKKHQNRNNG